MSFENENTRRDFLKTAAAFGISGSAITFDALNNIAVAAAPIGGPGTTEIGNDYKAIVCVYLFGGQDHANILIPWQDGNASGTGPAATTYEYTAYSYIRSNFDSTDNARKAQTMRPSTGNLSYARTGLPADGAGVSIPGSVALSTMTLPATTSNELTGTADATTGGWTTNTYGRQFALNPCYNELKTLYTEGHLAIMSNVGPLLSKVKRHDWFRDTHGPLPLNLYSHDDQTKGWMSGTSGVANPSVGIGGRIANHPTIVALNRAGGVDAKVSTQVSIDGTNTFMLTESPSATNAVPYQMGYGSVGRLQTTTTGDPPVTTTTCNTSSSYISGNPGQPYCLRGGPIRLDSGFSWNNPMMSAVSSRYSATAEGVSIYHDQWRQTMRQSIDTEIAISAAFLASPTTENVLEPFVAIDNFNGNTNHLARQLRMVAAMIRASNQLGPNATTPVKRQIFFVGIGGFDTHGTEFWENNTEINRMISLSLSAFATSLKRIRIVDPSGTGLLPATESAWSRVTTFTMSEFGRTLDSNNDGSDHGWGGFQFVMGGAVKGGKIYGQSHNVSLAEIPDDQIVGQKSRFMYEDSRAGAVPRIGKPPTWWQNNGTQGTTAYGGKAKMLPVPGIPAGSELYLNHSLDRGEMLPTMASDAMVATVAKWFGVPPASITGSGAGNYVFPTLNGVHGSDWDVGFMDSA
jgi:uncharacterized protein (DUF1501 family)